MKIWDDCQTDCQDLASDTTATSLTFFKRFMNQGYKEILAELGRPVTERTQTATTVADQRAYQMPPDFLYPKSITYTVGSTIYPVVEEESQEYWDNLTSVAISGIPRLYFVRPRFGYSGAEILLDPRPSGANTLTVVYEATDRDLNIDKYTTGTVAVTAGSATVTGTTTVFIAAMIGRYFNGTANTSDGMWYKVTARSSDTSITIENVYEGTTQSGVAYQIAEAFALPEEMQILPVYFALGHYYDIRREDKQAAKYRTLYTQGLLAGKRRWATKSRGNIIRSKNYITRWGEYPRYFPSSGIDS